MNMFFDLYADEENQCLFYALTVDGNLKIYKITYDSLYKTIEAKNKKDEEENQDDEENEENEEKSKKRKKKWKMSKLRKKKFFLKKQNIKLLKLY